MGLNWKTPCKPLAKMNRPSWIYLKIMDTSIGCFKRCTGIALSYLRIFAFHNPAQDYYSKNSIPVNDRSQNRHFFCPTATFENTFLMLEKTSIYQQLYKIPVKWSEKYKNTTAGFPEANSKMTSLNQNTRLLYAW